jgi:hypothetical protein
MKAITQENIENTGKLTKKLEKKVAEAIAIAGQINALGVVEASVGCTIGNPSGESNATTIQAT